MLKQIGEMVAALIILVYPWHEKSGQHSLLQIRVDLLDFEAPTKSVIRNPFTTRINKTFKQGCFT